MNTMHYVKRATLGLVAVVAAALSVACGGGGGGGGGGSGGTLYYPYEDLYGYTCSTQEATPGCTFLSSTGARINVTYDPYYNYYGNGSDDMSYVVFNGSGTLGTLYDNNNNVIGTYATSSFANHVGGSYIGLGTTGLYWENVAGGTYWLGKNGVLYSANSFASNYGKAINNKNAGKAADTNLAALADESTQAMIDTGAEKLVKEYGFSKEKATTVASALASWGIANAERGYTTAEDMDAKFKTVFGVEFKKALSAAKKLYLDNDPAAMQEVTQRSANALGLNEDETQKFFKGMYKKALANYGIGEVNW